ncbi:hypothetical protein Aple_010010 [Acrocarpospora pleiomorpha]|uniref:Surface-anchored protein n=1 Tax=Acrocarpospora pleiomorpha TaxID=90975 RepID=A0A5M3XBU0_9ACTN|nr:choice-of-anchor M domain-containing protein [Acrocarpospora pleiomorpha]GES18106.1 hypothetical protein Aple_010010 [Acrocarpospora pleiomorpha]
MRIAPATALLAALLGSAATPAAALPAYAQTATVVLDKVHVDISPKIENGRLVIEVGDDTTSPRRFLDPATVVMVANPQSKKSVPADPAYNFLGSAGSPFWLLPMVQDANVLWPGWSTERIPTGTLTGQLSWTITDVTGPGDLWVWLSGDFGGVGEMWFNSKDGLPDTHAMADRSHVHGNWAFSAEGVYRVTFEMKGTLAGGGQVSDTETIAFAVGDVDTSTVVPGKGTTSTSPSPTATPSASVSPTASPTPTPETSPSASPTPTSTPSPTSSPTPSTTSASTTSPTDPPLASGGRELAKTGDGLVVPLLLGGLLLACAGVILIVRVRARRQAL